MMRRPSFLALCLAAAIAIAAVHQVHATCSIASRPDKALSEQVFTNAQKAAIVERHDWYKIHTPEAVDDMILYKWNSSLEATARVWAKKCYWGHSENSCRTNVGGFSNTGENLASGYGSSYEPTAATPGQIRMVENWAGERAFYHWIGNTCDSGKVCGHYTQMAWHDSASVGCAMTKCPADTIFTGSPAWYLVCHYGKAGNWAGQAPGHIATGNACAQNRLASGASRCGEFGVCVMSGGNFHCECEPGYYSPDGTGACTVGNAPIATGADLCHPATGVDPCSGHGVCTANALSLEGYTCQCSPGYSGLHCETAGNPCSPNPCVSGTCSATATNTWKCACTNSYTGAACDVPPDPCAPNPCQNGGSCTRSGSTYTCSCATGYSGSVCQTVSPPPPPPPTKPSAAPSPPPAAVQPNDAFMKRLLFLINQDRAAAVPPKVPLNWVLGFDTSAVNGTAYCAQSGRALSSETESVTMICGFGGNALPESFADSMFNFWKSYDAWWTGSNVRRVGCGFKQGSTCSGDCSGNSIWKGLACIYAAGTSEAEEDFMVSWDHPMLYGHREVDVLQIDFHAHHKSGFGAYAAIAAAGVVAAAAAVGLAVLARRRRAAADVEQAVEYVELQDQLA